MDSNNDDSQTDLREALDDEATGERPVLDLEAQAAEQIAGATHDNVTDPNVLALRRVDAEIRRLMESWVDLENRLNDREGEIRRLKDQGDAVNEEMQATRHELGAARLDCDRLRGEAVDQRTQAESERRQRDEYREQAGTLQVDLTAARKRIDELAAELAQQKAGREQLDARLAEYHDAVAGMAAQLRSFESASNGHDDEKAELAARMADMDREHAELASQCRNAEAATRQAEKQLQAAATRAKGLENDLRKAQEATALVEQKLEAKVAVTARLAELQRELNAERDSASALRKQIKTGAHAMAQVESALEHQRQKTEAAENTASRTEQLLTDNRESLLATIAERDAAMAGLRERVNELDAERTRLATQLDEQRTQLSAVDSDFQAKRKAIAAMSSELDRLGTIQANVRKLDGMMSRQLSGGGPANGEATQPRTNTRLIVSLDGDRAEKYPLFKSDMVIGRSRDTDIRVSGPHTSRRHARVFIDHDVVMIEDLDSLNGITVNEKAVRKHELHDGDVLDVGGARLRFVDLNR